MSLLINRIGWSKYLLHLSKFDSKRYSFSNGFYGNLHCFMSNSFGYVNSVINSNSYRYLSLSSNLKTKSEKSLKELERELETSLKDATSSSKALEDNKLGICSLINSIGNFNHNGSNSSDSSIGNNQEIAINSNLVNEICKYLSKVSLEQKEIALVSCILRKLPSDDEVTNKLLKQLSMQVGRCSDQTFMVFTLANICGSIKAISSNSEGARSLLRSLTRKKYKGIASMTEVNLVQLFSGLRLKESHHPEVSIFVRLLTDILAQYPNSLNGDLIGAILYNMKDLSNESSADVKKLLNLLADRITKCENTQFSAKNVIHCSYGLRRCIYNEESSHQNNEINKILSALSSKLSSSKTTTSDRFNPHNAAMSIYGLQGMSSDMKAVRGIVSNLAERVRDVTSPLNPQEVGNIIYGLQKLNSDHREVRELVGVISSKLVNINGVLGAQEVGNSLSGLQNLNEKCPEVLRLTSMLAKLIKRSTAILNAQELSNSVYGLQNLSDSSIEVESILNIICDKFEASDAKLSIKEISACLYGLHSMGSDSKGVRRLLHLLNKRLIGCDGVLSHQELGMALFGLQGQNSENPDVRSIMRHLTKFVDSCESAEAGQSISNSLYGLQGMSTDFYEVRKLLESITMWIQRSNCALSGQDLANFLYGLQNASGAYTEVQNLIRALIQLDDIALLPPKMKQMSAQGLSNSLYGLKGCSSEEEAVRGLLIKLTSKLSDCEEEFSHQAISNILFGAQGMDNAQTEVSTFFSELRKLISKFNGALSFQEIANAIYGLQSVSKFSDDINIILNVLHRQLQIQAAQFVPEDALDEDRGISQILHSLITLSPHFSNTSSKLLSTSLDLVELRLRNIQKEIVFTTDTCALLQSLHLLSFYERGALESQTKLRLNSCIQKLTDASGINIANNDHKISKFENSIRDTISRALNDDMCNILFNQVLFGFHLDIILESKSKTASITRVAIEVDGPSHRQRRKRHFTSLRDKFLWEEHRIRTFRIGHMMGQKEVVEVLQRARAALASK